MKDLTQSLVKEHFKYKDGKLYWIKPTAKKIAIGDTPSWKNEYGYYKVGFYGKLHLVHRLIYLYHHGYLPKEIDHINGDRSDNRIENLRECNRSQNSRNSKKRSTNNTGYKGVQFNKSNNKWFGAVYAEGEMHKTEYFDNLLLAASALVKIRDRLHGDYARHN